MTRHALQIASDVARSPWALLALFVTYVVTAKVGIALPVSEGVVTPVWAPTGIAIAALALGGARLWPAVFAGALVANATSGTSVGLAAGIAVGNTLEAVVTVLVLTRLRFDTRLPRTVDIARFVLASAAGCVVAATNGVSLLIATDAIASSAFNERWLLWWFGDLMGAIVVGSLVLAVAARLRDWHPPHASRAVEFVAVNALLVATCLLVFQGDPWRLPQLLLPLWIWAALRFHVLGSTVATFVVAAIGIGYTIHGHIALAGLGETQTVQLFQGVLAIVGLSVLVVAAAISERDSTRVQLQRALRVEQEIGRHLRSVDEMKDSMLAAVSHELRTPLTSILALATMLQERNDSLEPDKRAEMYAYLSRESRRLDALLGDLLDLEQLRTGQLTPHFAATRIDVVVRTTFDRYSSQPREAKLDLEPVTVEADAAKVERIVDNLIGNAYKHTPATGAVAVSVHAMDGGALIVVDDEGPGVPDEAKETVFEPFNRGSAHVADVPGTGIGLSLVAHFTQLHGGRAWVEDREERGASFRVFLPGTQGA